MRFHSITTACVLAGALTWGLPATGMAQAKQTRGTFTAAAEIGARAFTTEPSAQDKGKFEEYRSLPAGAFLERLSVGYQPADGIGTYQLTARRLGQLDQSLWLQVARPNLYDFNVRWDKTPHLYSSDARSPGNEGAANPGFNTLPTPRPDSTAWKNAPYIGNVRTIWDPIKASLALMPTDALDTKFEWLRIGKKGGLPKSNTFSGSSGPQREYVSPIDETVNNIRVSQSYTSGLRDKNSVLGEIIKSYQGTVSYEYSKYNNALTSVMLDNPAISTPSISGSLFGTDVARISLAPSNSAQTLSAVAAVMLPFRTRITGSVNSSAQKQNDAFLPQTSNSAQTADPSYGLLANLRPSLEGNVQLTTVNVTATSHPIDRVTLGAKYRNHSYSNQTPTGHIRAMAISDRSIALADSLYTEWDPFTKVNTDFTAAFEVARNVSVSGGYAVEDFTRETGAYRADGSREKTPRVAVDFNALEWLSLHASYLTGQRRYNGIYREASTEVSDFRSYMFADRDRTRTNVMATITPIDQVSVGLSYQNGDDKFGMHGQRFGVMSDKLTTTGVDVDWTPSTRITLGVGYSNEKSDLLARYRYRTGVLGSVTYDNPAYYWTTTNADKNSGVSANVKAVLIPDKLEMTAYYSVIDAKFQENNVNDMTPTGGTAANNLAATVENWPEVSNKLTPMALAFQYKVSANWALNMRYNSEQYVDHNWQQEAPLFTSTTIAGGPPTTTWTGNLPGNVGATSGTNTGQYHFLGNKYNPYTARWLTFSVSWHPGSLPLPAGRALY